MPWTLPAPAQSLESGERPGRAVVGRELQGRHTTLAWTLWRVGWATGPTPGPVSAKARKPGSPRFKSRRRSTPSCRFTTGVIRVQDDRRHITLPRLGTIRTHENTRQLHRRLAAGYCTDPVGQRSAGIGAAAGMPPSSARSSARQIPRPGRTQRSVSTWASSTWQCWAPQPAGTGSLEPASPRKGPGRAPPGLACAVTPGRTGPLRPGDGYQDVPAAVPGLAGSQARPGQGARTGRGPALRRPAQTHHHPGCDVRDGRDRGPQRGRDAPQPELARHLAGASFGRSAASSATRPNGTAATWSSPTAGSPAAKPARPAGQ